MTTKAIYRMIGALMVLSVMGYVLGMALGRINPETPCLTASGKHGWGKWEDAGSNGWGSPVQKRYCTNCNRLEMETR